METVWKLSDSGDRTHGGCQWGPGVTHSAPGGRKLCTAAWIHAYRGPELAVLMDPIHGGFGAAAHLWRCEAEIGKDDGTKLGCTSLTTIEQVALPTVTTEQRVKFAILAARQVYHEPEWTSWAEGWLAGRDHSGLAASAAAEAAYSASAASAARSAARSAEAVWSAAWSAAWSAWSAESAAWSAAEAAEAAWSAWVAARLVADLDLPSLACQACEVQVSE